MNDRDGQHDFDFEFGHWKIHNRRLLHPLSGSNDWVEFDGTVVAQPIWDGSPTWTCSRRTLRPATLKA